mgnify:CR=1 FL=1
MNLLYSLSNDPASFNDSAASCLHILFDPPLVHVEGATLRTHRGIAFSSELYLFVFIRLGPQSLVVPPPNYHFHMHLSSKSSKGTHDTMSCWNQIRPSPIAFMSMVPTNRIRVLLSFNEWVLYDIEWPNDFSQSLK